jgi:glutamate carboxypeptidase
MPHSDVNLPDSTAIAAALRGWIECESPTRAPDAVAAMADIAAAQARAYGLSATVTALDDTVGPLVAASNRAPGDERPGILVIGHLDTVHPVGMLQDNPYRIEGNRLYGPGCYDMKAGIYLALLALGQLSRPGSTRLPVDFVMVPDEETGSHRSRATTERYARNARYALVCEPARPETGKCVTARKGTGLLRLNVKGRAAHAGTQHDRGRNAIREMAHQVLALEAMTDYARGITVNVGTISGGTATNTVPAQCSCVVDFRLPDPEAAQATVARMQALKPVGPDTTLDIDVRLNRPPMVRTEAAGQLLGKARLFAAAAGFTLDEAPMTGGGSDANFTSAMGVPTLDGLGADGDGAHAVHEHIIVDTLGMRARFWHALLRDLE